MVILDHDGALAEPFELRGVEPKGLVAGIALRVKHLRRPWNSRFDFADLVDLTLEPPTQEDLDLILAGQRAARFEVERINLGCGFAHPSTPGLLMFRTIVSGLSRTTVGHER